MCEHWSQRQTDIYRGLSDIGAEIAGFFKAALQNYYNTELSNRAYMAAHAAREIDGAIRNILAPDASTKSSEGLVKSVMLALNADKDIALANDWINVSKKLNKYAHRHGGWKKPRTFDEFKYVWEAYELVLMRLIGSFYKMTERIDRLLGMTSINEASSGTLLNLLRLPIYEHYVFSRLDNLCWFFSLKEFHAFNPSEIRFGHNDEAAFWEPLKFLERVSVHVKDKPVQNKTYATELIRIIGDIFRVSRERLASVGKPINHMRIWWFCIKIITNIPNDLIKNELPTDTFRRWLSELSNTREANDLAMHEISEKLLRKFLEDESTIEYAEIVIDVITGIIENPRPRKLLGDKDVLLVMDSYWLLKAFDGIEGQVAKLCSENTIYGLADRLRAALEYARIECHSNLDIDGECYQIRLERAPLEGCGPGEISFDPSRYECVVGQYSKGQLDDVKGKGDEFALHYEKPNRELKRFPVEGASKEGASASIKKGLPEKIKWHKAERFTETLDSIFNGLSDDFSHIWFKPLTGKGIEDHLDSKEALTAIFRDVLLARCDVRRSETKGVLKSLFSDRYRFPLFKRLALLGINRYWQDYKKLFQQFIDGDRNVLRSSEWEVELHELLRDHCMDLSNQQKKRLIELIDDIPDHYREKGPRYEARWRYEWLSPLKDCPDFAKSYDDARKGAEITEEAPYEPGRDLIRGGFVGHKSPLSVEEVLSVSIPELVIKLKEFKGADEWGILEGKPDREGLADVLQSAAKTNPGRFVDAIEEFSEVPYIYVWRLIRGLDEAWKEKKDFNWNAVFEFSLKYLGKKNFLEEALKDHGDDSGGGKYIGFIDALADLIGSGSRDDKHAFDPAFFPQADAIFDAIHPFLKGEKNPDTQRDALTYSMNTTLGRTVEAFIVYSLRVARTDKKEGTDRCAQWGTKNYDRYFDKGIEAYVWLGRYLPKMRFIDKEYVEGKIGEFAGRPTDDYEWRMFMEGYLSGAYVYDDVYALMRRHYAKAIQDVVFDEAIDKRLVEHIAIGYLREHEALEDITNSLFRKMLDGATTPEKRRRWLTVAGYFWSISDRTLRKKEAGQDAQAPNQKIVERIKEFWEWAYEERERVEALLGDDYADFLGKMADLTIYLGRLDADSGPWLLLSAPYAGRNRMTICLVKYLTKFEDDESLRWIGKIYVKMLESTTPTFRKEDIECIVRRLYKLGAKEFTVKDDADTICNTYGRRGEHFLRDLFNEYNP